MEDLKLIALDPEDLKVLSCHLQDAVIRVGDMAYLKDEMRFAAIANRFDWEQAARVDDATYRRRRAGLRFERVTSAKVHGIDLRQKDTVLELLAVTFEPGEEPSGVADAAFLRAGARSGSRSNASRRSCAISARPGARASSPSTRATIDQRRLRETARKADT